MAFTVPNEGENAIANHIVGKAAIGTLLLMLFKNDATIGETTVLSDLTEVTETGYSQITLTGASWSVTDDTASFAQQTFTITEAVDVYGAAILNGAGTGIVAVEKFGTLASLPAGGGTVKVTPSLTVA